MSDAVGVGKHVRVTWLDAQAQIGWEGNEEHDEANNSVTSYGVILGIYDKWLVIAGDVSNGDNNRRIMIPRAIITEVEEIQCKENDMCL